MRMRATAAIAALFLGGGVASGQQADTAPPLEIGAVAPEFALPGANRDGVLERPVRLADFRGKTVVLAFFFRARTPG